MIFLLFPFQIVQISFYIGYNINSYQLTTYPPDHWWMKYAKGYRRFLEKSFLSVVFPLSLVSSRVLEVASCGYRGQNFYKS
jgi:hypothetical protein